MPNSTGGVRPPRPGKPGGGGYRVNKKGQRIGGRGHRLGGQGKRLAAPRAPAAPSAPSTAETPGSHKDRYGPIKVDPSLNPKVTVAKTPQGTAQNIMGANKSTASGLGLSSYNPQNGGPDPRDDTYWQNFRLIQGNATNAFVGNYQQQLAADDAYGKNIEGINRDREDNRSKFARSLIGTGLLRSGYHNAEQIGADADRDDTIFAETQRYRDDNILREGVTRDAVQDFLEDELGLYGEARDRYGESAIDGAAEGDPLAPGKAKKNHNTQAHKSLTKRIDSLKDRYKKAKTPKARKRIHAKIKELRKQKNTRYSRDGKFKTVRR